MDLIVNPSANTIKTRTIDWWEHRGLIHRGDEQDILKQEILKQETSKQEMLKQVIDAGHIVAGRLLNITRCGCDMVVKGHE